jgi:hypothetical protein
VHLHGAMRSSTLVDWSAAAGVTAPDPRAFADFGGFHVIYGAARACVTHPGHLRRLIGEVVEEAAADVVAWIRSRRDGTGGAVWWRRVRRRARGIMVA